MPILHFSPRVVTVKMINNDMHAPNTARSFQQGHFMVCYLWKSTPAAAAEDNHHFAKTNTDWRMKVKTKHLGRSCCFTENHYFTQAGPEAICQSSFVTEFRQSAFNCGTIEGYLTAKLLFSLSVFRLLKPHQLLLQGWGDGLVNSMLDLGSELLGSFLRSEASFFHPRRIWIVMFCREIPPP